jgi:hypothetical protein
MKFISKELSIKLKEKGFNRPCFGWYNTNNEALNLHLCEGTSRLVLEHPLYCEYIIDAPTTDQVLEWLREDCGLYISMACSRNYDIDADGRKLGSWVYWWYEIHSHLSANLIYQEEEKEYETYDEAILAGINFVVEHLI